MCNVTLVWKLLTSMSICPCVIYTLQAINFYFHFIFHFCVVSMFFFLRRLLSQSENQCSMLRKVLNSEFFSNFIIVVSSWLILPAFLTLHTFVGFLLPVLLKMILFLSLCLENAVCSCPKLMWWQFGSSLPLMHCLHHCLNLSNVICGKKLCRVGFSICCNLHLRCGLDLSYIWSLYYFFLCVLILLWPPQVLWPAGVDLLRAYLSASMLNFQVCLSSAERVAEISLVLMLPGVDSSNKPRTLLSVHEHQISLFSRKHLPNGKL